jgi:tRNA U55 pseudouridine synthase TruB
MSDLRRTTVGDFSLRNARAIDELNVDTLTDQLQTVA